MCDLNEGVSTLAKIFPKEVGDSILSDDVVDMSPCGHHRGATWEEGHNRRLPLRIQWCHGDYWLALTVRCNRGSTQKIYYTANTCSSRIYTSNYIGFRNENRMECSRKTLFSSPYLLLLILSLFLSLLLIKLSSYTLFHAFFIHSSLTIKHFRKTK